MSSPAILQLPSALQTVASTHHITQAAHTRAGQNLRHARENARPAFQPSGRAESSRAMSLPLPSEAASTTTNAFQDLDHFIALGCLHINDSVSRSRGPLLEGLWAELLNLPEETKLIIGDQAATLLDAQWIRLFLLQPGHDSQLLHSIIRVYLLPEDWNRRSIDRRSQSLKKALQQLLSLIDTSPIAWTGNYQEENVRHFDPWASAENVSLYYLFNRLPSPVPDPAIIKSRHTRAAVCDLLKSAAPSGWEEHGEQPLVGLRTRLYPYQARSASLMIQREAAPQLQLDPRLETRISPNGKVFYFGARDGSALQEPRYYEATRGGILAETMGLGKTLCCLAVILTTKGQYPQIPDAYMPPPPVRNQVGRLSDMAISASARHSISAKTLLEQFEMANDVDYTCLKDVLDRNLPFYEIPHVPTRLNRTTEIHPPRQIVLCGGTIIVVPKNLLHQWQSEICKHVLPGALKVLVIDTTPSRVKVKPMQQEADAMKLVSELPSPTELMSYDVVLFTRPRFEKEIVDGTDDRGRRLAAGVARVCNCPYIGSTSLPDCSCVDATTLYESPLRKLHWLRIIIDEGHSFSSSVSNAVLMAKQIHAERRWIVSGSKPLTLLGVSMICSNIFQHL
jgi:SNF2 family DNA or RNA helicase